MSSSFDLKSLVLVNFYVHCFNLFAFPVTEILQSTTEFINVDGNKLGLIFLLKHFQKYWVAHYTCSSSVGIYHDGRFGLVEKVIRISCKTLPSLISRQIVNLLQSFFGNSRLSKRVQIKHSLNLVTLYVSHLMILPRDAKIDLVIEIIFS